MVTAVDERPHFATASARSWVIGFVRGSAQRLRLHLAGDCAPIPADVVRVLYVGKYVRQRRTVLLGSVALALVVAGCSEVKQGADDGSGAARATPSAARSTFAPTPTATAQPSASPSPPRTIAPVASQEQSISLHLVRSETPEGMNGPTVYIFRVEGIELKGKGAQVTVTPRGTGVVNEVENAVLAFVQSDWPSGTYRVALRVEGQQAETTIAYTWREQATPAPAPTRAIAPTAAPAAVSTASPTPAAAPVVTSTPAAPGYTIRGTVTRSGSGTPLGGVSVSANAPCDPVTGNCASVGDGTSTDASGRYSLRVPQSLPQGCCTIWFGAPGNGANSERRPLAITGNVAAFDVALPWFLVSGVVTSTTTGAPLDTCVSLQQLRSLSPNVVALGPAAATNRFCTGSSGRFAIFATNGRYQVQVPFADGPAITVNGTDLSGVDFSVTLP